MRKISIGDVFVFVGNNTGSRHYNNFKVGETYVVGSFTDMSAFDEYRMAVLFRDCLFGTYEDEIWINFELVDERRERVLDGLGI